MVALVRLPLSFTNYNGFMYTLRVADPYLTLTYSKLGKPLYSTRIIKHDRNPVFEETAFVLVDVNVVRLREKLSFQLWDSDRMSVVSFEAQSPSPFH